MTPTLGQTVRVPQQAIRRTSALTRLRRPVASLTAVALLASGCYSYETRTFEITIPETAESSVVVARDGTLITTLVAPQNRTSARRLDEIPFHAVHVRPGRAHLREGVLLLPPRF